MRTETAITILEYFPGAKWAKHDSAKHAQAAEVLAGYEHEDIVRACKTMRATMSRTHATAEEIVGEIKRNAKKDASLVKQWQGVNTYEVEQHRREMRDAVCNAPAATVRAAVAFCRQRGTLGGEPLPSDRMEWSAYAIGMVYNALERVQDGNT